MSCRGCLPLRYGTRDSAVLFVALTAWVSAPLFRAERTAELHLSSEIKAMLQAPVRYNRSDLNVEGPGPTFLLCVTCPHSRPCFKGIRLPCPPGWQSLAVRYNRGVKNERLLGILVSLPNTATAHIREERYAENSRPCFGSARTSPGHDVSVLVPSKKEKRKEAQWWSGPRATICSRLMSPLLQSPCQYIFGCFDGRRGKSFRRASLCSFLAPTVSTPNHQRVLIRPAHLRELAETVDLASWTHRSRSLQP